MPKHECDQKVHFFFWQKNQLNDALKSDQIQRNFSIEDFNRLEQRLQPEKTGLFEVYQTPG